MDINEIKSFLSDLKDNPELLDAGVSIHESAIHEIIRAEKRYSYGLDLTTEDDRRIEIEKIVIDNLEKYNNENQKN